MRLSPLGHLVIAHVLLTAAVASLCYGLIDWHANGFSAEGIWLYDAGWRPHPVHFVALGIGLIGPALWDIFALTVARGERRLDVTEAAQEGGAAAASEPSAGEREGLAPRMEEPSAGEREGLAPRMEEPAEAASTTEEKPRSATAEHALAPRTFFRPVNAADRREFLALTQDGRDFHSPWIKPPLTAHTFRAYLRRNERDDHLGFAICLRDGGEMVGVVNINHILGGALRSGTVAYFAAKQHAGKGYMREGLTQVKEHAFQELRLHRLEANIQPGNTASQALVRGCGFDLEGVAPRFLYINGVWRDHERWAAVDEREELR